MLTKIKKLANLYLIYILYIECKLIKGDYLEENYPKSVIEDANLDTAQLIQKYKYPVETHFVKTADNYILRLHRIPNPNAPPIFLMHGLQDSSPAWIVTRPDKALGYYLYDSGYDVWMGNARGNRYSRNHTTLNPDTDRIFWDFSWHEIGFYDLPASIDYVLAQTGYKKVGYIGNSQGTESFWVFCSMHPEYNNNITMMHAITPAPLRKHTKSPFIGLARSLAKIFKNRIFEFLRHTNEIYKLCYRSKLTADLCIGLLGLFVGSDDGQGDPTLYPTLFGHFPAGSSFKQGEHYLQLVTSDGFRQFDYGRMGNMKRYGKSKPPLYPLYKITCPVGLYYTYNDNLASEVDVKEFAKLLPNVVEDRLYPYKKWNHATLIYGSNVRKLAYKGMLEVLKNIHMNKKVEICT